MRQGTQSAQFMQIVIVLLLASGVGLWIAIEKTTPANANDLKVEVGNLRSYVSEAERLIEQAEAGKTTENFFRVEIEMLREKIQDVGEAVGAEKPSPGLEEKLSTAHTLVRAGAESLGRLPSLFKQPQQMDGEKAKLEEVFQQAIALEKSLAQESEATGR